MTEVKEFNMSICTFNDGLFQIMFETDDGRELIFEGQKKLTEEELQVNYDIAPPCVWTTYKRIMK